MKKPCIKLVYLDLFDRKAKYHIFCNEKDYDNFVNHNKIEIIGRDYNGI